MAMAEQLLRIEHWRSRLIQEGIDAIPAFMQAYPHADPKLLKRFVQRASAMHHKFGTPRFLLRYIRELDDAQRSSRPS